MSGDSEDYNSWRLQSNGGIKYRFLGLSGEFVQEGGSVQWRGLFRSSDLYDLLVEMFPPPDTIGGITYPRSGTMPGFPALGATKVAFKSWNGDKPGDVFNADPTAPVGTYSQFIEVTVFFSSVNGKDSDPNDPRTFLEITSNTTGEYIHVSPEGAKADPDPNPTSTNDQDTDGGSPIVNPNTGEVIGDPSDLVTGVRTPSVETKPIRTPSLNSTILVPKTEWSIKWKSIPQAYFANVLIHRLRLCNGRVNSKPVPFLFWAKPETILFAGFDYAESYTWRSGFIEAPPIDVSIKLIEKSVIWHGTTIGHNHSWIPGQGWQRIWIRGNEFPYNHVDMNFMFKV